jgi:hypothetical protein
MKPVFEQKLKLYGYRIRNKIATFFGLSREVLEMYRATFALISSQSVLCRYYA